MKKALKDILTNKKARNVTAVKALVSAVDTNQMGGWY